MRATVRTTLALGDLLEIPIGVASATTKDDIRFDTAAPDGAPRQQLFVHPDHKRTLYALPAHSTVGELADGDAVAAEHLTPVEVPEVVSTVVKGVRVGDDFRVVPPSEIDYATAATHIGRVELLEVIDYRRVPTDRLGGAHWIQPDPGFARPLAVLIAALKRDGNAMLVKWSARSRQRLGVIRVRRTDHGDALMLNDVTFAAQWKDPDDRVLEPSRVEDIAERSIVAACEILKSHHGIGEALETAEDDLPALHTEIVERAHDGLYDDPQRVLKLAAEYDSDDLAERSAQLLQWAEQRWPEIAERREDVDRVIAEGGDDVGEKLAALVG